MFSQVSNKQLAWNELVKLASDEDSSVRYQATNALGSAFSQVPDKQQAWNDLIGLTNEKNKYVRYRAADALGSAFSQVPDKQLAWNELVRLANDEDNSVRTYAKYSLGKVSIFKASQAEKEEDYKKELENAIKFFEIATKGSHAEWLKPAQFCLPFYRSLFHRNRI